MPCIKCIINYISTLKLSGTAVHTDTTSAYRGGFYLTSQVQYREMGGQIAGPSKYHIMELRGGRESH